MLQESDKTQALDREMHKRRPHVGAVPGTLALPEGALFPRLKVMVFDEKRCEERGIEHPDDIRRYLRGDQILWVDVRGLGDEKTLLTLAEIFSIHPLALEDIVHVPQRPKAEAYDEHLLLLARMLTGGKDGVVELEQVSMLIGDHYVVTFQEHSGDVFEPVRARLRQARGTIRTRGGDYLSYVLLDTIVDAYFPVIEQVGDCIDELEIEVFNGRSARVLESLTELRSTLISVRRSIWPLRDAVNALIRDQPRQLSPDVRVYLRDVHDHCVNATDMVETYRELSSGLLNTHLSVVSHKMNEIIKVLTVMSTIFLPLTFFTGLYGMNFDVLPELHWKWSYPALWGVMLIVTIGLLIAFRRRGWIGDSKD